MAITFAHDFIHSSRIMLQFVEKISKGNLRRTVLEDRLANSIDRFLQTDSGSASNLISLVPIANRVVNTLPSTGLPKI